MCWCALTPSEVLGKADGGEWMNEKKSRANSTARTKEGRIEFNEMKSIWGALCSQWKEETIKRGENIKNRTNQFKLHNGHECGCRVGGRGGDRGGGNGGESEKHFTKIKAKRKQFGVHSSTQPNRTVFTQKHTSLFLLLEHLKTTLGHTTGEHRRKPQLAKWRSCGNAGADQVCKHSRFQFPTFQEGKGKRTEGMIITSPRKQLRQFPRLQI